MKIVLKTTNELLKDAIWAGLNRPDIEPKDADITVFGIPFDGGVSFRDGAAEAPAAIRSITYTNPPTTELFEDISSVKIKDLGDITGGTRDEIFESIEQTVSRLVSQGSFFTMLGGDHSVTIPVLRGVDKALNEPFGIIHIDAHFDLCDQLTGDRLSHGCTERRAAELKNVGSSDNIFFVGIRSAEPDELEFAKGNPVNVISAVNFHELGVEEAAEAVKKKMSKFSKIYLTVDIDALDPAFAAGTGTPSPGGLSSRELLNFLRLIFDLPIIGMDLVEVAPKLDPSWNSVFAARKILSECWANHTRKIYNWRPIL